MANAVERCTYAARIEDQARLRDTLVLSAAPVWLNAARALRGIPYRRALMRATTRRVVAERGVAEVHIRDLAERCGVSPQTLYNNLGGRNDILASSIDELLASQIDWTRREAALKEENFILGFCKLCGHLAVTDAAYTRALIAIFVRPDRASPVTTKMKDRCVDAYRGYLTQMREEGRLRPWVNIGMFSELLHEIIVTALVNWAASADSPSWLLRDLTMKTGLPLLGVVKGDEIGRIERILVESSAAESVGTTLSL